MLSWAHIGHASSFGALLVGGCGARAVSRKTPIYFIYVVVELSIILLMLEAVGNDGIGHHDVGGW